MPGKCLRSLTLAALGLAACSGASLPATADLAPAPGDATLAAADLATALDLAPLLDLSPAPDLTPAADLAVDAYPAGPYGSAVGDTIAPLVWEGYVNPTAIGLANKQPYVTLAMNDLRRSGNRFALLYAADFW